MKRSTGLFVVIALLALVALGAAWQLYFRPSSSPAGLEVAPAPEVEALDWDTLRSSADSMDALELRQHGLRLFQQGDPDRAFLMFKTAAKKGDGWSALAVGEMYDPATFQAADFEARKTAFSKPNPRKALEWYDMALAHGEAQAQPLRDRLVAHIEDSAASGDPAAAKLLKKIGR